MKGLDYYMDGLLDAYLNQPEDDEMTLSKEDEAFIEAYANNVASAPEDVVREYLAEDDHTAFYEKYSEYYGSIADAYGVWHAALTHEDKTKAKECSACLGAVEYIKALVHQQDQMRGAFKAALLQLKEYSDNSLVIANGMTYDIEQKLKELK